VCRSASLLATSAGSVHARGKAGSVHAREKSACREAAEVYRELTAARPHAFRPDLARSLNNLSNRLVGLGRREEALAAI
jgi:hypothetical protein